MPENSYEISVIIDDLGSSQAKVLSRIIRKLLLEYEVKDKQILIDVYDTK